MTTYSQPTLRKKETAKGSGRWAWVAVVYAKDDGGGRKTLTHATGVPCDPPKDGETRRGRKGAAGGVGGKGATRAREAAQAWRDGLVTEAEADEAARATAEAATDDVTVLELVDAYWASRRDIEPVTRDGYAKLRKHLDRPPLSGAKARDLTPAVVEAWLDAEASDGVSSNTQAKALSQLRYACRWGVATGRLDREPTAAVATPRRSHREPNPLDDANVKRLVEALGQLRATETAQHDVADAALLALLTGLRLGELCGLRWQDVDGGIDGDMTVDGALHVRQVVTTASGHGSYLKPYPKNRQRRDVPLNRPIVDLLNRRRSEFVVNGDDLAGAFVFARPATPRQFPSVSYLSNLWRAFASVSGVVGVQGERPHFHDLRHTFATQALIHGVDVVTVSAILGHTSTTTTLRHYARFLPNANAAAMERMGEVLTA